jgi:hypothetical protein
LRNIALIAEHFIAIRQEIPAVSENNDDVAKYREVVVLSIVPCIVGILILAT